jgi:hypothetical protein
LGEENLEGVAKSMQHKKGKKGKEKNQSSNLLLE